MNGASDPNLAGSNRDEAARPWGGDPVFWAIAFAGWLLFYGSTAFLLEELSLLVVFTLIFAGFAGTLVSIVAVVKRRGRRAVYALMGCMAVWAVWSNFPVRDLGLWLRFKLEFASFEVTRAELDRGQLPACLTNKTCDWDAGPPARAVYNWGGLIDNWAGLVIDPSGTIMDVERNRGVFGGRLVACRAIEGPYYFCGFT